MSQIDTLVADNVSLLDQAASLARRLDRAVYAAPGPPPIPSGVGSHVRHVLDFYDCLLGGLAIARVDYDARKRDPRSEVDPLYVAARIERTTSELARIPSPGVPTILDVRAEGASHAGGAWARSSVARELEFLLSHTIHHFALVAMMLRLRGVEPGAEFGVAPSTLAYWRRAS
jgi:hypothetical protein